MLTQLSIRIGNKRDKSALHFLDGSNVRLSPVSVATYIRSTDVRCSTTSTWEKAKDDEDAKKRIQLAGCLLQHLLLCPH